MVAQLARPARGEKFAIAPDRQAVRCGFNFIRSIAGDKKVPLLVDAAGDGAEESADVASFATARCYRT